VTTLTALDAAAAAERLASGEFSSRELTEAYLETVASVDPALNCFVAVLADTARDEARAADERRARGERRGPLDGIPVAVKDNIDVAGVPTTNGMGARPGIVAGRDAEAVRRLRAAGMIVLGKLNMHEGALGGTTDNPHHGRTHNPRRPGFTPGGSSGGSGAAVAAHLCAGALGTDTMGSVRLPAAYCGVAGLKPTHGLISAAGVVPLCRRLDDVGLLARSVEDLSLLLGAFTDVTPDGRRDLAGLVVGVVANFERVALDPEVGTAFAASLETLRHLGASLRRLDLPGYDPSATRRAGLLLCEAEAAVIHQSVLTAHPAACSPSFRALLEFGGKAPPARVADAARRVDAAGDLLRRALQQVAVVVAPTAPQSAFSFETVPPTNQADLTALANFGGCPAVSVPGALGRTGLPIGIQLIGAPLQESALLGAARVFAEARKENLR
jgi:aspartyl-tRNA(Asn)/glutamyl-tRNA(Gln) amidotransferase subunit A